MVLEITTFRLTADADERSFLEADARLQAELYYSRPGLLRRTTARDKDGGWIAVALWDTNQDARATDDVLNDHPAARAFRSFVDAATIVVRRYSTLD